MEQPLNTYKVFKQCLPTATKAGRTIHTLHGEREEVIWEANFRFQGTVEAPNAETALNLAHKFCYFPVVELVQTQKQLLHNWMH